MSRSFFVLNWDLYFFIAKIIIIASIAFTYYGYLPLDTFNLMLIIINVLILLPKAVDFFHSLLILEAVNKLDEVSLEVFQLVAQVHIEDSKMGGRLFRNITEIPLMLFFAYHGYIFNTWLWMYFLFMDEMSRYKTVTILTTKTISNKPLESEDN